MKKFISLLLVCIMVLTCAPVMAFAADTTWQNQIISLDQSITNNSTVTVKGSVTLSSKLTIDSTSELIIEDGATLTVSGRIANNGKITVKNDGNLYINGANEGATEDTAALSNYATGVISIGKDSDVTLAKTAHAYNRGTIINSDNLTVKGTLQHYVKFPADFKESYNYTETWNRKNMTVKFTVEAAAYSEGDDDLAYLKESFYKNYAINIDTVDENTQGVWVDHGNELFILITPSNGDGDWVDTGRMQLVINGDRKSATARINNTRGIFSIKPTSALDITVFSTKYKDIVRLFEVELPRTQAYYVITRENDIESATVEYGKTLSFRVVLAEDYDKSDIHLYVNTLHLEPDEFGYYDITGPISAAEMATEGGLQEDVVIEVMGVAPNERTEMMNSIVSFIQEIVGVIKSILEYFLDIFGLGSFEDLGGALGKN